jgi:hypothetical protein
MEESARGGVAAPTVPTNAPGCWHAFAFSNCRINVDWVKLPAGSAVRAEDFTIRIHLNRLGAKGLDFAAFLFRCVKRCLLSHRYRSCYRLKGVAVELPIIKFDP